MSKDFAEYKKQKEIAEAYEQAGKIQEVLALSICPKNGAGGQKDYEGHIAVSDVLNKIDAMVRMFERSFQDNDYQESSVKIIEVITNLYDLAQIKMAEAKKQAVAYMEKATGVSVEDLDEPKEVPDETDVMDDEEPVDNDEKEIAFKTRGPMELPEDKIKSSIVPPESVGEKKF